MLNCSSTPVMASIAASLAFDPFFGGSPARSTPTEGSVYCPSTGSIRSCWGSSIGGRSSGGAVRSTTAGRRVGTGGGGGAGGPAPGGPPGGGGGGGGAGLPRGWERKPPETQPPQKSLFPLFFEKKKQIPYFLH